MMNISSIFPDVMITINMNVKAIMLHMMMETAAVIYLSIYEGKVIIIIGL